MFQLQCNVPKPGTIRPNARGRRKKYPFESMNVGDMFFIPDRKKNTFGTHVTMVSKQLGRQFSTRLCYMKPNGKGWALCEPSEEGAVLGVGVWRDS